MQKIIVIGANHAGTSAIKRLLSYRDTEVVAFDSNSNISFLGCGMALWIGEQIAAADGLFYSNKQELEHMGARIHMETPVDRVDFDKKTVYATGKDGTKYEERYDKLIFATGSWPIIPQFEGGDLKNIQLVKLYQHAQEVIDKLEDADIRNVVVVGAGYIGVELAEAFQRKGKHTTLIDIAPTCLPSYYDVEFTDLMKETLRENGIKLAFGEKVEKFNGENGKVTQVVTDKGVHDADMVVLCIGFRPNTDFVKSEPRLTFHPNGAFLVDRHQQTSIPDVYAVGDCATVYDNASQEMSYIALASNAVRTAIVGAENARGNALESPGVQGSNGISIYGLHMVSTGLTYDRAVRLYGDRAAHTDYEDLQKPEFIEHHNFPVKIRIVYDKESRRILGAQIASRHDVSMAIHMFSLAVQEQLTIEKLALTDIFFLPHFNKPYNYITMAAITAE